MGGDTPRFIKSDPCSRLEVAARWFVFAVLLLAAPLALAGALWLIVELIGVIL